MMALAVAEQFPGVQESWEAAQSHVNIGSVQGSYEIRWEMGDKADLILPPSACPEQKGVQGVVAMQKSCAVWQGWEKQQWISSAVMH